MQKIRTLSPDVVAKIAAGEVIEKPAYAVKELIENAIDATSTAITIHIEEAGLKRIQVIDNGEGMSREDLKMCFLPHTTSKLKDEDELLHIKTLGFRGEALSSLAAISRLIIQSRSHNETSGTVIEIQQGRVEDITSIGTPPGTIVTVDNLFYTVPARKKFLRSIPTEFRQITEIVMQYALSYPSIHFMLTHNKKVVLDLPGKQDRKSRLVVAFGDTTGHLLPINFSDEYLKITGFIGKPQIASKSNQRQFLFINNRSVSDKLISLAVKEAFGTLLPSSSTPVFIIFLSLPFEMLDVNVHPRKEQVNFANSRLIFDLVKQSISETLLNNNITYHIEGFDRSSTKSETASPSATTLKDIVLPWNRVDIGKILTQSPLLQIHQTYILAVTKNGMIVIDQHAAHERILFDDFVNVFEKEKKQKHMYTLPKPFTISVSLPEKQIIEEYKNEFEQVGFSLEHFGGNTYILRSIPTLFKGRKIEKIIKDMISDLIETGNIKTVDTISKRMLAFLSCRAAVKAGDVLLASQMKQIIQKLNKSPNNTACPHGRPTRITLSLDILHTYFKRI